VHGEKFRGIEVDVTEELLKKYPVNARGGKRQIVVPHGIPAVLSRGSRVSRGVTTDTGYDTTTAMSVDEVIRNNLAMAEAGATRVTGLTQTVPMYRQTAGLTVYNVAESASITESSTSVTSTVLTPNRAGAYTTLSREAQFSAQPDLANFHMNDIFQQVAVQMDEKAISGTGTNEPTGLLYTTGVGGSSSASYSYETATEQEADCQTKAMATAYLMNRSARGKLKARAIEPGSGDRIIDRVTGRMNGMPVVASDNVPANTVIYGAFSDVIIAEFGGYNLVVDEYSKAEDGLIRLIGDVMFDVYIRQPERFNVADGGTI
jgi:HK97 family phage major capsid protein